MAFVARAAVIKNTTLFQNAAFINAGIAAIKLPLQRNSRKH